jgi:integrase
MKPSNHATAPADSVWDSLHVRARGRPVRTGYDDHDLVFARPDGTATHPEVISRTFDRIVARTGLPRIRFHDVRHTHASLLLKAGVPVKVVSERLGHATPSFTLDVYGRVLPGMQAEAAAVFSRLMTADPVEDPVEAGPARRNTGQPLGL